MTGRDACATIGFVEGCMTEQKTNIGVGRDPSHIVVQDVRYRVEHKEVLKGLTLEAMPGEILCVMGMSGSGKTTLLHCIGGLTAPTSGEIWVGKDQIVGMTEDELNQVRERMGMVFQSAALFDSLSDFD